MLFQNANDLMDLGTEYNPKRMRLITRFVRLSQNCTTSSWECLPYGPHPSEGSYKNKYDTRHIKYNENLT